MERPVQVFCSYADQDEQLQKELVKHLQSLIKQQYIEVWDRSQVAPGMPIEQEIQSALQRAHIILLLISADYFARQEEYLRIEWEQAMQRYVHGDVRVIPIILRPVDWQIPPLDQLQALPAGENPVTLWGNRDEAFEKVAEGLRQIVSSDTPPELPLVSSDALPEPLHQPPEKEKPQPSKETSGTWVPAIVLIVIFVIIGTVSNYNTNQQNASATATASANYLSNTYNTTSANYLSNTYNTATAVYSTSTAIAYEATLTAEMTPTPSPTPTPYPAYTNAQSPSGAIFYLSAQQVILNAQLASRIDNSYQPVTLTTSFTSGQTVYLSYQWAQGYTGYAQARWWLDGEKEATYTLFNGNKGGYGEFSDRFFINGATAQGTVEIFYCQDSACSSPELAYARPFSVI